MLFQDKLLTSIKNYLLNDVHRKYLDRLFNRKYSQYNNSCIYRDFRYLFSQNMDFWGKNVRLEQKKIISERKDYKYELLNKEVFIELTENLISFESPDYEGFMKLSFNMSNIQQNRHYPEAEEHIKQDLDEKFPSQLNDLKKKVDEFNKNLDEFKKDGLEKLVSEYLKNSGFKITNDVNSTNPPSNTIIIDNLLFPLKSLWFHNGEFEILQRNGENMLHINHSIIASFSNTEERKRIEDTIEKIKKCERIIKEINSFKEEPQRIFDEGQKLSKEIEDKIVKKIENKEYETTCDICKKLDNF